MYYPSSENKGTDQLCSYCEADLCLCFRIGKNPVFSYNISGSGDYYCSGNDLSNFMNIPPDGVAAMALKAKEILEYDLVKAVHKLN